MIVGVDILAPTRSTEVQPPLFPSLNVFECMTSLTSFLHSTFVNALLHLASLSHFDDLL